MDVLTHVLASFALTKLFFPRVPPEVLLAALLAGTAADVDRLSVFAGPAVFFGAYRTYTHSILAAVMIAAVAAVAAPFLWRKKGRAGFPFARTLRVTGLAAIFHLATDVFDSDGATALWPFRGTRFALDWVATFDTWILATLLAGILVPVLFRLVTEEIGARSKAPGGRVGALIALIAITFYLAGRGVLHANAEVLLDARTYRGESPRRAAAFAESVSVFEWKAIVETERALYQVNVSAKPGAAFFPDAAAAIYKPEGSAALDAARDSEAARRFLSLAEFPRATIQKTAGGYSCNFRDLRYAATGETETAVAVQVVLGPDGKVLHDEFVWERELPR
ncbi:MAG TPA: metal-dependent hydrolase [Methylomirabilota bacterium]|nr:metal-dependent hydrolase [Methylomirabilota bacterium]